ncbi:translocase [Thalassococcus profundi]|uniref:Translocase n=1 Tax=Thalassococcus profundi TaxID=2282382 RepID=A0A369TSP7_9RHOB|nr:translocase [Thalassococcus profundi]RDD67744.1 translocase [Thalassococcus profundi]
MARKQTRILALGTLGCALAIGYVMQFGFGLPGGGTSAAVKNVTVSGIVPTSSSVPKPPLDLQQLPKLPEPTVQLARVEAPAAPQTADLPKDDVGAGFDCAVDLMAEPAAGAMVSLTLTAPCNGSERVTFHHHGLMFTEVTQPDGTLMVDVPALTESAMFIASFGNGASAVGRAQVTSLPFYDRVAVQWKGDSGLQLHAREFSAEYFGEGHVWSAAAGDVSRAASGDGGFITTLGSGTSPDALRAEVYSFPAGTARRSGEIALTVEAEITAVNCTSDVEAQTLELHKGGDLRVRDLTLAMPDCDSVGDFLVLKNLVEDLTIASN